MKKSVILRIAVGVEAAIVSSLSFGLLFSDISKNVTVLAESSNENEEVDAPDVSEAVQVPVPIFSEKLVYNGSEYRIADYLDSLDEVVVLSGDIEATDAGFYSVYLTLPEGNFVWSDSSFNGEISWQIQKAELSLSWEPRVYIYTGDEISPKATISAGLASADTDKNFERDLVYSGDTAADRPGYYQIEVEIKADSELYRNYALASGAETFSWVIKGSVEEKVLKVEWDLPAGREYVFNGSIQIPTVSALYNEYGEEEDISNYYITYTGDRSSIWAGNYVTGVIIEEKYGTPIRVVGNEISYRIIENDNGLGNSANMILVTFVVNGGSQVASQTVLKGEKVERPEDPTRNGYTFVGWFKDADCVTPFNFAHDSVMENTRLYARWFQNETKPDDDLLTLLGCNSSISASLALVGGMLVLGVSVIVIKKKSNKK